MRSSPVISRKSARVECKLKVYTDVSVWRSGCLVGLFIIRRPAGERAFRL